MYKYCNVGGECLINILSPKFKMTKSFFSYIFLMKIPWRAFSLNFIVIVSFSAFIVASQEESKSEKASETRQKIDKIASLHVCDFFICSSRRTKNNTQVSARRKIIRTRGKKVFCERVTSEWEWEREYVWKRKMAAISMCLCNFFSFFFLNFMRFFSSALQC